MDVADPPARAVEPEHPVAARRSPVDDTVWAVVPPPRCRVAAHGPEDATGLGIQGAEVAIGPDGCLERHAGAGDGGREWGQTGLTTPEIPTNTTECAGCTC